MPTRQISSVVSSTALRLWPALLLSAWAWATPASAQIAFLGTEPAEIAAGEPLFLSGQVSGAEALDHLVLNYRVSEGDWKQADFILDPPDTYVAHVSEDPLVIPPEHTSTYLDYYIVAFGKTGSPTHIRGSQDSPERIRVVPPDKLRAVPEPERAAEPEPATPVIPKKSDSIFHDESGPATSIATGTPTSQHVSAEGVTQFKSDQLKTMGVRTLADLAALVPGMSVSRNVQGFWDVAVRGRLSPAEVVVILDGMTLNNPFDGRVDWELPLESVESVEIENSPNAALVGPGAFAIIRVQSLHRDGIAAAGSGGFQSSGDGNFGGTGDVHINGGHTFGNAQLTGLADFDWRSGAGQAVNTDAVPRQTSAGATNDSRLAAAATLHAEVPLGGQASMFVNLRGSYLQQGALVGAVDVLEPASSLKWDTISLHLGARVPFGESGGERSLLSVELLGDEQITSRNLALFPSGATVGGLILPSTLFYGQNVGMTTVGLKASFLHDFSKEDLLTVGIDLERQGITSFSQSVSQTGFQQTGNLGLPSGVNSPFQDSDFNARLQGGVFAQNVWQPIELIRLTLNARADVATGVDEATVMPSFRAALVVHPISPLSIRAVGSRSMRLPTFEELLSAVPLMPTANDGLASGFNPQALLKPVTVTTAELGIDASEGIGPGRGTASATGFVNRYDNPIVVMDQGTAFEYVNRTAGEQYAGVEGQLRYDWTNVGTVFANLSWVRGQDLAEAAINPAFSYLNEVPQLRFNVVAAIPFAHVGTGAVSFTYGSERKSNELTDIEAQRPWQIAPYALIALTFRTVKIQKLLDFAVSVYSISLNGPYLDPVPRPDTLPGLLPREGTGAQLTIRVTY